MRDTAGEPGEAVKKILRDRAAAPLRHSSFLNPRPPLPPSSSSLPGVPVYPRDRTRSQTTGKLRAAHRLLQKEHKTLQTQHALTCTELQDTHTLHDAARVSLAALQAQADAMRAALQAAHATALADREAHARDLQVVQGSLAAAVAEREASARDLQRVQGHSQSLARSQSVVQEEAARAALEAEELVVVAQLWQEHFVWWVAWGLRGRQESGSRCGELKAEGARLRTELVALKEELEKYKVWVVCCAAVCGEWCVVLFGMLCGSDRHGLCGVVCSVHDVHTPCPIQHTPCPRHGTPYTTQHTPPHALRHTRHNTPSHTRHNAPHKTRLVTQYHTPRAPHHRAPPYGVQCGMSVRLGCVQSVMRGGSSGVS